MLCFPFLEESFEYAFRYPILLLAISCIYTSGIKALSPRGRTFLLYSVRAVWISSTVAIGLVILQGDPGSEDKVFFLLKILSLLFWLYLTAETLKLNISQTLDELRHACGWFLFALIAFVGHSMWVSIVSCSLQYVLLKHIPHKALFLIIGLGLGGLGALWASFHSLNLEDITAGFMSHQHYWLGFAGYSALAIFFLGGSYFFLMVYKKPFTKVHWLVHFQHVWSFILLSKLLLATTGFTRIKLLFQVIALGSSVFAGLYHRNLFAISSCFLCYNLGLPLQIGYQVIGWMGEGVLACFFLYSFPRANLFFKKWLISMLPGTPMFAVMFCIVKIYAEANDLLGVLLLLAGYSLLLVREAPLVFYWKKSSSLAPDKEDNYPS